MQIARRQWLAAAGAATTSRAAGRPKIAALVTEYRKYSHGQHIVDRFLEGYGWNNDDFLCRYLYKDIVFNTNLTDDDFLPEKNDLKMQ